MAITWGAVDSWGGAGKAWVGIDLVQVSSAISADTWRFIGYLKIYGAVNLNFNYSLSGAWGSATGSKMINKSGINTEGTFEIFRKEVTFTKTSSTQSKSATFAVSNSSAGISATHTRSMTLPSTTIYVPNNPINVSAEYVGNNQASVKFSGAATPSKPVQGFEIEQMIEGGKWGTNTQIQRSSATSVTFTGTSGTLVKYRVRVVNSAGKSGWVETNWVSMIPLAPTSVKAVKIKDTVAISWVHGNKNSQLRFEIWDESKLIAAGINGVSYTVAAPDSDAETMVYRVRTVVRRGRVSEFTSAPAVILRKAPAQPTLIIGNKFQPLNGEILISWTHNPVDGSDQSSYELQYRRQGESVWNTLVGARETQRTLSGAKLSYPQGVVELQIRTKGIHPDFSPWSEIETYELVPRPTISLTAPDSYDANFFNVTIGSNQSEEVIVEYVARIFETSDPDTEVDVLTWKEYQRTPVTTSVGPIPNNSIVRLTAVVTSKVSSLPAEKTINIKYASPGVPEFAAQWVQDGLSVTCEIESTQGEIETASLEVELSADGGKWEKALTLSPAGGVIVHNIPPLNAPLRYRGVAVSEIGARTYSKPVNIGESIFKGVVLNWGANWEDYVICSPNTKINFSQNFIHESQYTFAGQNYPSIIRGIALAASRRISYSIKPIKPGVAADVEKYENAQNLSSFQGKVIFRSFDSPPILGAVFDMNIELEDWLGYKVSLVHTRVSE